MKYKILSFYWSNIDVSLVQAQREVFSSLGLQVEQQQRDGVMHGTWLDTEIAKASEDDILVFCDIDAFPTNRKAFDQAVEVAEKGEVFGLAQVANHHDKNHIYAGPMFLSFKKKTWIKCGEPTLCHSSSFDVGQNMTYAAEKNKVKVNLKYPTTSLKPLWALGSRGIFGIGTFFENDFFHLFESRKDCHVELFKRVARDVIEGKNLCFEDYLKLIR